MEALQSGVRPVPGVTAWILSVYSPGRGWRTCRVTDLVGAELLINGAALTEAREGHRIKVELVVARRTHRVTSDREHRGGRWVDLLELPPPAAWALKGAAGS